MDKLGHLSLGGLRAFEAAARLGSFKLAANELSVTPAAISHQVKGLELQLRAALFMRLHRSLELTSVGMQLSQAITNAFEGLNQTLEDLTMAGLIAGHRTLSVSAAPTFAARWLAPRIYQFQAAHPSIELQLRSEVILTDPARDPNVDVAIRYGKGTYGAKLQTERLWAEDVVIAVGSPEVAERLVQPFDLIKARILRTSMPVGSELLEPIGWRAWFSKADVTGRPVDDAISAAPLFSTTQLALEAAATGQGLALAPRLLVADDLRTGKLVKLFEISLTDPFGYWFLYRRERTDEVKIRAFVQWLKSSAST